ncbi:hypothetical protein PTTG_06577 [Puccinia triticina 1-1 BBBD Race 1]|uniref:Secreted protein n=2 Tax=Puccinia triticina TaxID=208348 RepID=A0A180GLK7_PUCT1|nr:uncharacterized protein PtA15_7A293 [Puccinia triticina]OAV93677.1 hypothetical protein PTTG_06577 [Puccinia triticina 1-1 BBBD Race 1]WAQ86567.1 hypothetical protein PtA15_7A293 [Puccinia triticina]WAR56428.1 hypothetical protein PtB15_7B277 [Puccinia triticina]
MKATVVGILLAAFALACVKADNEHTQCYKYFLNKDHCVQATGVEADRCTKKESHELESVRLMTIQSGGSGRLQRRYNGPATVAEHATQIYSCPGLKPDPNGYEVCVWAGDGNGSKNTGWLDKANKVNCGKQVYIQRKDDKKSVQYATITGGCDFGNVKPESGCFQIGINQPLFESFKPSQGEKDKKLIASMTWDFNNLNFDNPKNAAY